MIRQITLIRFKPTASSSDIDLMGKGFKELADVVPGIRRFEFGSDLQLLEDAWNYALVIDFIDLDDWRDYRDHPRHLAFAERFMPLIDDIARVQYQVNAT